MSRLIDADALLERWKYKFDHSKSLEECIKTQPTAYDVAKVMEELNKATIKISQKYLDMVEGKETQCISTYNEFVLNLLNRTMKQVINGGVENE